MVGPQVKPDHLLIPQFNIGLIGELPLLTLITAEVQVSELDIETNLKVSGVSPTPRTAWQQRDSSQIKASLTPTASRSRAVQREVSQRYAH